MGDTLHATSHAGVKISIEHAVPAAELQLQPCPFPDLKRRRSEPLREFGGGQAEQAGADPRPRDDHRPRGGHGRRRRVAGAGGEQQGGGKQKAAHAPGLSSRVEPRNPA